MCEQCWAEYGSPEIVNDRIIHAASLVNVIYTHNLVGMPLHVFLDDWNIEGDWQLWQDHKTKVSEECWEAAEELREIALSMTISERASFLALAKGYFEIRLEVDRG